MYVCLYGMFLGNAPTYTHWYLNNRTKHHVFLVNPGAQNILTLSYLSWIPWVFGTQDARVPNCLPWSFEYRWGMESTTSFFQVTFWSPKNEGHLTPEKVTRKNRVMINCWPGLGVCFEQTSLVFFFGAVGQGFDWRCSFSGIGNRCFNISYTQRLRKLPFPQPIFFPQPSRRISEWPPKTLWRRKDSVVRLVL